MKATDMNTAICELAAVADRHAVAGDQTSRLAPEVVSCLTQGPLLKAMLGPEHGGSSMTAAGMARMVMQVSGGCGSAGLTVAWYVGRLWLVGRFPDRALATVLDSTQGLPLLTDALPPRGQLSRMDDGGYLLNGRWPYATGASDSNWLLATAVLEGNAGESPALMSCLVPRRAFTVLPTWKAMGMRATASDAVTVSNWRVESDFVADFRSLLDGQLGQPDRVSSRYPFDALAFIAMASCAVGMAERVLDEIRKLMKADCTEVITGESRPAAGLASHFAKLKMARTTVMRMAEDLHQILEEDAAVSAAVRQGMRATASEIIEQCALSSTRLSIQCGTRVMLDDSPVQRFVRDIITLSSHVFIRTTLAEESFQKHFFKAGRSGLGR